MRCSHKGLLLKTVTTLEELNLLIQSEASLFVLYGGEQCGVCQAIKPKIQIGLGQFFPEIKAVYIDCHKTTDICAQKGVFTLPVIQVYFSGQKFIEEVRSFGLNKLFDDMRRPYEMMYKGA